VWEDGRKYEGNWLDDEQSGIGKKIVSQHKKNSKW